MECNDCRVDHFRARYHVILCPLHEQTTVIRDALEKATQAVQWQPIETAPKDGTRVLFYTPEDKETGWLAFFAVSFVDEMGLDIDSAYQWQDGLQPTHWMPLPEPPPLIKPTDND